jgi:CheY-like chemotaxis protein
MRTVLDDFGFECDIAANGRIAIEKLENKNYDMILMDLQMPEMNGFEATEFIRNNLQLNIPIIALTADVTTVDLAKCRAVGMNDYIAKPIDERLLYSKIVGVVKKPVVTTHTIPKEEACKSANITDLDYLVRRTKADPQLMMEMISLYLAQMPPLVAAMKESVGAKDWKTLHSAVHKMIPSFAIMGISDNYQDIAKEVQELAGTMLKTDTIPRMAVQLEDACLRSCVELEGAFNEIKNTNVWKSKK